MSPNVVSLVVAQCETHARRMLWAKRALQAVFPLNAGRLRGLDDEKVAIIDQFVGRFAKLQDAMGAKLLPMVLELTKEQGDLEAYLDKLNRLEKIGALPSVDEWLELREMRNAFAHDYPEDSDLQAAVLNRAFSAADRLVEILQHVKGYAARYVHE
ncbi:MAG: hypothetical protein A2V79_07065 [Betaproteobacteria bacterium RBG_16_56_24]|nr:MAG: hypothetical protein A2V79_07065 [Betaproteobacteria bacterium RBG_16_56_24]